MQIISNNIKSKEEAAESLLFSFRHYYDISKNIESPFIACAEFHSHREHYLLVKSARIADIDENEYVYFAAVNNLSFDMLETLSKLTWEKGLSKVKHYLGHKSSDIILFVLADVSEDKCEKLIHKIKNTSLYKFGLHGYSRYKLAVIDLKNQKAIFNRAGKIFEPLISNIFNGKQIVKEN